MPTRAREHSGSSEIERKFLVRDLPALDSVRGRSVAQGYLALPGFGGSELEIRVRQFDGAEFFLTFKSSGSRDRLEVELPITAEQFQELWPFTGGRRLEKKRYSLDLPDNLKAELDQYLGALAGLLTVEVEFPSAAAADHFVPPVWFGQEISDQAEYRNARLALRAQASTGAGEEVSGG